MILKKYLFSLIIFFSCIFVVCAEELKAVTKKYIVTIDGETYAAHADYVYFCYNGECEYNLDAERIKLYDKNGVDVNIKLLSEQAILTDYVNSMGLNFPSIYGIDEQKFNNDEKLKQSLPKFLKFNNNIYVYTYDKEMLDDDYEELDLVEILEFAFQTNLSGYNPDEIYSLSSIKDKLDDYTHSYNDINNEHVGKLTSSELLKRGNEMKDLLEKVTDIDVCTEDDLNAIRSQRIVSFLELKDNFTAPLSSSCYNVIFGSNGLYKKAVSAYGEVDSFYNKDSAYTYTMSFLFFETYYQQAYSFLSGNVMQVEPSEVVECGFLGEKTVYLLQNLFDALKISGIVVGVLLAVVDIFKAVVGNEGATKKSLQSLMKRLGAIVLLMITPFLIELIFDIVNTIGVTNPICGIR